MKRLLTLFVCVVLASVMTFADTVYYGLSINGSLTSSAKSSGNVDGYDTYVAKPLLSAGDLVEVVSLMENNARWLPTLVSTAELDNFWLSGDTALLCLQDGCYEFTIQLLNDDMSNSKLSIGTGSDCISESAFETLYSYYYGAPTPSGLENSYTDGSVTAYFYSGSKDLIFKGGGTMQDYSSGSSMAWNQYNSQIQSVYMSGTAITYIGNNTFANCTQLTHVALPPILTGIGANAFSQCSNLQTITCPAPTPPSVDATAFNSSTISQITLNVPDEYASLYAKDAVWGQMIIPNAANGSGEPEIVSQGVLGDNNALSWIFYSNGQLIFEGEGDIPDYTSVSQQPWYAYGSQITDVYMNAAIINVGDYAFAECSSLTTVTLSSSTSLLGSFVFSECPLLTRIIAPAETVMSASELLFGYTSANENITIEVPASQLQSYQGAMFWYEFNIVAIDNGSGTGETITDSGSFGDNFTWTFNTDNDLRISGEGAMPSYMSGQENAPWYSHMSEIDAVIISEGITSIGEMTFTAYPNIEVIYLPSTLAAINYKAFGDCNNLTNIYCEATTPPTLNEDPFHNLTLSSITVWVPMASVGDYRAEPTWGQMNVVGKDYGGSGEAYNGQIGGVYWELKEGVLRLYGEGGIEFPSADDQPWAEHRDQIYKLYVTGDITLLGTYAVGESTNLNDVTIQTESLDSIGISAFSYCTNLMQITILTEIVISADPDAFIGVTTSNITLYMMEEIMESYQEGVWADMQKMPLNTGGSGEEVFGGLIVDNMRWAFNSNTGLLSIYGFGAMPDWIESMAPWSDHVGAITEVEVCYGITYVCNGAFANCLDITKVTLAASVDSIGENIFTGNNSPIQLYVQNMTPPGITENTFANIQGCVYAYCYESAFSAYDSKPLWNDGVCLGYDDDPQDPGLLSYQPQMIYINNVPIDNFNPNLYNYDITVAAGSEVPLITYLPGNSSQNITVEQPSSLNDAGYVNIDNMATYSLYFSTGGSSSQGDEVVIELDTTWRFIMLPSALGAMLSLDDIEIDGEVVWAMYEGSQRAAGQSGWKTADFSMTYYKDWGHIVRAAHESATITFHLPENFNQMPADITLRSYPAAHAENANWNFIGNPYNAGYSINGLYAEGLESPITVWNGTGYTTYTPGIDEYTLQPFEPFFIQIPDSGAIERIELSPMYQVGGNSAYLTEGLLPGKFSVAEDQKVQFSKGNLRYLPTTNEFEFAGNQFDYIGANNDNVAPDYNGYIDVYAWGTGDSPTKTTALDEEYVSFVDWGKNPIFGGGNQPDMWRTLTGDEWFYLIESRADANQKYGLARVRYDVGDTINGLIILPDEWELPQSMTFTPGFAGGYEQNDYLIFEWQELEAAGAVFLPAGGYTGTNGTMFNVGLYGSYWSSSPAVDDETKAFYMSFYSDMVTSKSTVNRSYRRSVRLVRDVQ